MQTWTAMQIPTSKLQKRKIIRQIRTTNIHILRELPQTDVVIESKLDSIDNFWDLGHHGQNCYPNEILEEPNPNIEFFQETTNSKLSKHAQNRVLTCETLGWLRIGWMFSVTRSAQAEVSTVATTKMSKDLHLDQWTTAPWFPVTAQRAMRWTTVITRLLAGVGFGAGDTYLVLLQHGCHRCGSESSVWKSDQWCKQLARERTLCTPKAWRQEPRWETWPTQTKVYPLSSLNTFNLCHVNFLYLCKRLERRCQNTIQTHPIDQML